MAVSAAETLSGDRATMAAGSTADIARKFLRERAEPTEKECFIATED
jgi:hypothetical protein